MAKGYALTVKLHLGAKDFTDETLISYPLPDDMLDLVRQLQICRFTH